MTWSWRLPVLIPRRQIAKVPPLEPERTRIVVPTYRDWKAAHTTIEGLLDCRSVSEIVLVDDNAGGHPPAWVSRLPIRLATYLGNRGPAFARNTGALLPTRKAIDWLYFTDTACTRDPTFLCILAEASAREPRHCVAIAAPVHGSSTSRQNMPINHYMTEEAILCPPWDDQGPQAIVTANAAVSMAAFQIAGGFDESFRVAGDEDLDLGLRLRQLGTIGWAPHAVVHHKFQECLIDFRRRFKRYGAGAALLQRRWQLPSIRPAHFQAHSPTAQWLADEQVRAMQQGFDEGLRSTDGNAA